MNAFTYRAVQPRPLFVKHIREFHGYVGRGKLFLVIGSWYEFVFDFLFGVRNPYFFFVYSYDDQYRTYKDEKQDNRLHIINNQHKKIKNKYKGQPITYINLRM